MIRVTVELISAISPSRNRILGQAVIANDQTGTSDSGNYGAKFSKWAPKLNEVWKTARVCRFNRRTRGAWDLLYLALKDAVGSRND